MKNDDYILPSVNYCDGLDRCILYCILFVFMLVLYRFCVATEFSVNKDLYISRGPNHPDEMGTFEVRCRWDLDRPILMS